MAMVICIGSTKGGVGKSTIAVNLAAAAAKIGKSVLLVDTDVQKSSLSWRALRSTDDVTAVSILECTLHRDITKLKEGYDLVILDSGGRDDARFRSAIGACDVLLIPVLPSQFDVFAAEDTINILREKNAERSEDIPAYILMNQIKERSALGPKARKALETFKDVAPVLTHCLHNYEAYKNCLDSGSGVVDMKNSGKAGNEMGYLLNILGVRPN
jgi:chromosome partitioning protein